MFYKPMRRTGPATFPVRCRAGRSRTFGICRATTADVHCRRQMSEFAARACVHASACRINGMKAISTHISGTLPQGSVRSCRTAEPARVCATGSLMQSSRMVASLLDADIWPSGLSIDHYGIRRRTKAAGRRHSASPAFRGDPVVPFRSFTMTGTYSAAVLDTGRWLPADCHD